MGRLAGFSYREVTARLRKFGFEPRGKSKGSHEQWINRETRRITMVARHPGDIPEGTLRAILKQADIGVDEFLPLRAACPSGRLRLRAAPALFPIVRRT
ncbi:type II toxin-antitoxin system HicA family toxin [Sphingomonas sp. LY54]|uniref:type II toxin-antitoxin system HicA family toxin n=1 Tax=Sphingomonas sp. LY54 TaxID=3095343 RepID=UPI002D786E12|nr:type II toxin-antitoxin system HicA family toxin [Sphingomonas sp. LY54]WRP28649.1 type II toxin-antitoxin system HicA family toxin [Sphingomonas sp. LY54]